MIFNGGHLHQYIFTYFEPIQWVNTLSRVSKTWNKACKSNALWSTVMEVLLKELPSIEYLLDRKNLYQSIKELYLKDSKFILTDFVLCYEMGVLNVDKYIRHTIEVRIFTREHQNTVVVQYSSKAQPNMGAQTVITAVKNTEWFLEPMRQLILYLHIKYDQKLILWGNTLMCVLLVNEIHQNRKRIKRDDE